MIIDSLIPLAVEIGSISGYPGNPRIGKIADIRASIRDHGQYKPVLVQRSTGYIIAGNQTWQAMVEEGEPVIAAAFTDVTDVQARKIVAFDNRVSDLAEYEDLALASLLQEIQRDEDGLEGSGYTDDDLDALLEKLAADADPGDQMPDPGDEDPEHGSATYGVIVTCGNEDEQAELLERLQGEGLTVRALIQ